MGTKIAKADTTEEFVDFLRKTMERSKFEISEVPISSQEEWVTHNDVLGHRSGGYFSVTGCRNEVTGQENLILHQPQRAFNGLAIHRSQGRVYVLLHARIEPGNIGVCQYGPTIQSTPANYLRVHGGKPTPYLNLFFQFDPVARPVWTSNQLDLGRRYYQKSKTLSYIELREMVPTEDCLIWVAMDVISQNIDRDNFMNIDLRSMLAIFDWDGFNGYSSPPDMFGAEEMGTRLLQTRGTESNMALVSISDTKNWAWSDTGIADVGNTGVSAKMFRVSCTNREVASWNQPLLCSSEKGEAVLYVRDYHGTKQVLLSLEEEFGVPGELIVYPTLYKYPGEQKNFQVVDGVQIRDVEQCEEGGRFFENVNRYRVIGVDHSYPQAQNQVWVGLGTLKAVLQTSNRVSIQLRCMASLLLETTDPAVCQRVRAGSTASFFV